MTTNIQKNTKYEFTGGDNLTGPHQLYHELMMRNELEGGKGAYKVSYAGGKSGISFGGNQMDMKDNAEKAKIFVDILTNAKDKAGNAIFTKNEITAIAGYKNQNLMDCIGKTVESFFGAYLPRVNVALSSEYGRAKIDAVYLVEIKNKADHIEQAIEKMTNVAAKKFYDSDIGRLLLFDYHNQLHIDFDGRFLADYINGEGKEDFKTKKPVVAPRDNYTMEDHFKFIQSTEQYFNLPHDCLRRIDNVIAVTKEFLDITIKKSYELVGDFAFSYDHKKLNWHLYPGVALSKIPPAEGQTYLFLNEPKSNYFFLPASKEAIPYIQNRFYFRADTKQLFYVSSSQIVSMDPPVCSNNSAKWISLNVGLSPKTPKPFLEYGNNLVAANYEIYNIFVKTAAVEVALLKHWIGNVKVILEESKSQHTEVFFKIEDVSLVKKHVGEHEKEVSKKFPFLDTEAVV